MTGILYLLRMKKEPEKPTITEVEMEILDELRKVNENLTNMSKSMDGMSKQFGKWFTESALTRSRIEDIWKKIEA